MLPTKKRKYGIQWIGGGVSCNFSKEISIKHKGKVVCTLYWLGYKRQEKARCPLFSKFMILYEVVSPWDGWRQKFKYVVECVRIRIRDSSHGEMTSNKFLWYPIRISHFKLKILVVYTFFLFFLVCLLSYTSYQIFNLKDQL